MALWYGLVTLTIQVKSKLVRLLKIAMKTIRRKENLSLESLYEQSVLREAHTILANPLHVLHIQSMNCCLLEDGIDFQCVCIITLKSIL